LWQKLTVSELLEKIWYTWLRWSTKCKTNVADYCIVLSALFGKKIATNIAQYTQL